MSSTSEPLPVSWRTDLQSRLDEQENLLAVLDLDLDARLRFAVGVVALTERRLLTGDAAGWREWPLDAGLALALQDHAGVGTL
ncbi:MAG: ABC transporter, partial [Burkholderiaceae bacterium]